MLGIEVVVEGQPVDDRLTVYAGNHLSYLDIPVVGSVVHGSFIAKREMRGWPVFGWLAMLQRTVFISRDRRDAAQVMTQIDAMLEQGRNLIVFPEGTSSAGEQVLPFKSSLFSVLGPHLDKGLKIQPFTIDLRAVDGCSANKLADRDAYAYYRDMTLAPHLWAFMRGKGAQLRLVFHPPLALSQNSDRKQIAVLAHARVASALEQSQFDGG
ncbi:MAG: 1-acyl-sn-glycerol-3-phosphate acyltransferase [Pseudomonadota bacterium]|nr:1-acyl-sn-glycerol-3-phosphate acyltransferase [Pseudomonadota bacterium]